MVDVTRDMIAAHLDVDEGSKVYYRNGRYYPYVDTVGKVTIGRGRNLTDKGISEDEKALMDANDLEEVYKCAYQYPWFKDLDPARQGVVLMLIFNLGPTSFSSFRNTIGKIEAGDYAGAADNMAQSLWHRQVGHRAEVYERIMRTGVWE